MRGKERRQSTAVRRMDNNFGYDQRPQQKEPQKGKYFLGGLAAGLGVALFISAIVFIFVAVGKIMSTDYSEPVAGKDSDSQVESDANQAVTDALVQKMELVEQVIDRYFYQEETDKQAMVDSILKGMVSSLGDPYSEYYTAEELQETLEEIQGSYYGIGCYVAMDTEKQMAKISGIIEGAPASEVDIRVDDYIYAVECQDTYGMSLTEVVSLIKGPEGTKVNITFYRDGEYVDVEVERRKVKTISVNQEMFEDGMAYIQITEFDESTIDDFTDALAVSKGSGMKGLIIDLRANPGGSLNAVLEIARRLLPEGLICYTEDRDGNRKEYYCDGKRELKVPLVVLIDGNSASASEILAGAIKDYKLGTLVGTTTFGKGIVQQPITLSDGSAVKLTISTYFTPNGNNVHGVGIEPDIVYEFDGDRYYSEEAYDNQLEKAKEVLAQLIKNQ